MKIVTCKIDSTYVESILHIFDITGQLFLEIGIKSNLAATDLLQLIWKLCGIGKAVFSLQILNKSIGPKG